MKERDWYDGATFGFQIFVALLGATFTLLQFLHNLSEEKAQGALLAQQQEEAKRATVTKYFFDAYGQSISSDAEQKQRGNKLLTLINTNEFFENIGLDRRDWPVLRAMFNTTQSLGIDAQSGQESSKPVAAGPACSRTRASLVPAGDDTARGCWVYLGWYKGAVAGGKCVGNGVWVSQYLEFAAATCPTDLKGKALPVAMRTGALYVRAAPATPFGLAAAVGGLNPGQAVTIDDIQSSTQNHSIDQGDNAEPGSGQIWGRIASISK